MTRPVAIAHDIAAADLPRIAARNGGQGARKVGRQLLARDAGRQSSAALDPPLDPRRQAAPAASAVPSSAAARAARVAVQDELPLQRRERHLRRTELCLRPGRAEHRRGAGDRRQHITAPRRQPASLKPAHGPPLIAMASSRSLRCSAPTAGPASGTPSGCERPSARAGCPSPRARSSAIPGSPFRRPNRRSGSGR